MAIFEIAKNGIWSKKIFREIDLFDFTSFLAHYVPTQFHRVKVDNQFFREVAFLAVLNFFSVQKLIFDHF